MPCTVCLTQIAVNTDRDHFGTSPMIQQTPAGRTRGTFKDPKYPKQHDDPKRMD